LRENWAKALDFEEWLYKESVPGFQYSALQGKRAWISMLCFTKEAFQLQVVESSITLGL